MRRRLIGNRLFMTPIEPYVGREDYHLSEDLADKAIEWINRQRVSAPDRPFCYFAYSSCSSSVSEEWVINSKENSMSWDSSENKSLKIS